jgi:hypothetical protein
MKTLKVYSVKERKPKYNEYIILIEKSNWTEYNLIEGKIELEWDDGKGTCCNYSPDDNVKQLLKNGNLLRRFINTPSNIRIIYDHHRYILQKDVENLLNIK